MPDYSGRRAVVTGAGSGNGLAIAELLLSRGAKVALFDIAEGAMPTVVEKFPHAYPVITDVSDPAAVIEAFEQVEDELGHLDLVVNNAGIVRGTAFPDLTLAEWNEVFAVNSTGPFLVSQAALPLLRAGADARGSSATSAIVNITSIEAHIVISSSGDPQVHYNASKGALLQLTRATAVAAARDRVRVNAVAPGLIQTPFTEAALANPNVRDFYLERTPLGRVGTPLDIAYAVSFLGSDEASWITGSTVFVDGGWMAY